MEGQDGGLIRMESTFIIDPELIDRVWLQYTAENEEKYFRKFVHQFVGSWEKQISPNWELLVTSQLEGCRDIGPNLKDLPDELLAALSKFLFISKENQNDDDIVNLSAVSEIKDLIKCLAILCRCTDNIPLISSMDFVKHLTEMNSSFLQHCLQIEATFFHPKVKREAKERDIRSDILDLINESCHFFETLYDPYFQWRAYLCGKEGSIKIEDNVDTPTLLHQEIIPFLYESFETALVDKFPKLAKEMLNVFGAVISGSRHNALKAISPATSKMLLKTVRDTDTGEDIHITAIYCSAQSISILECTPVHERQLDLSLLIHQYQQVLVSLCVKGNNLPTLIEGVSLLTRILTNTEDSLLLKETFAKNGMIETLLLVIRDSNLNDDLKKVLLPIVINRISLMLLGCDVANQKINKIGGYSSLFDIINCLGPPDTNILHSVLFMATHGRELHEDIQNVKPLIYLLRWITETDYENAEQQVWLCQAIRRLCNSSLQNRVLCCDAGIILEIILTLKSHERLQHRSATELLKLLEILGKHSITPYELKQLIKLLNDTGSCTPDSEKENFSFKSRIIHVISSMAKGDGYSVCRQYLDCNSQSGINVPNIRQWSGPVHGFSFHCWLRLEKNRCPDNYRRILYSFYTNQGQGFEAFITQGKLVVVSAHKKEFLGVPLEDQILDDENWHCIGICHFSGRRPFGSSSLIVYIDGAKRLECSLKYPIVSSNDPIAYCSIGAPMTSRKPTESNNPIPKQSLKDGIIDAIKIGIPGVINLPQKSNDPHVKWTLIGLENDFWGKPAPLHGQLGTISLFQDTISLQQSKFLYLLGPMTPLVHILEEDTNSNDVLDLYNRLVFLFSPRAREQDKLIDLHKGLYEGILSKDVKTHTTNDVKDVINCMGGVQVLFPLLESLDKIKTDCEDGDTTPELKHLSLQEIQDSSTEYQQLKLQQHVSEGVWELIPLSSFSDWKLEQNPISGFLTLIKNLIREHTVNLEQLLRGGGVAIIGALIQKAHPSLIDVNVLMACQLLMEMATLSSHPRLLSALHKSILLDFRIWSRAEFTVQIGHIQYLKTVIKGDRKLYRKKFGVKFFIDVIRTFYGEESNLQLLKEDVKTVRKSLFEILKIYISKDGKESIALINFLLTTLTNDVNHVQMAWEIVELLGSMLIDPSISSSNRDQIYEACRKDESLDLIYCILSKPLVNLNDGSNLKLHILKLILKVLRFKQRNSPRLLLDGACLGFYHQFFSENPVEFKEIFGLLEINLLTHSISDTKWLLGLMYELIYFPLEIKMPVGRRLKKLLVEEKPDMCAKIACTIGWQESIIRLLVKHAVDPADEKSCSSTSSVSSKQSTSKLSSPTKEVLNKASASAKDFKDKTLKKVSDNVGFLLDKVNKVAYNESELHVEPRFWEYEVLDFESEDNFGDVSTRDVLSQSSSIEDLSSSRTGFTSNDVDENDKIFNPSLCFDEDCFHDDSNEETFEKESIFCELIIDILFQIMWNGLSGKTNEEVIEERGQVVACINMLGLNNVLYMSHVDLKRLLVERLVHAVARESDPNPNDVEHALLWTYDFIVLDNCGDFSKKVTETLLDNISKLAENCLSFSENEDNRSDVIKMTFDIFLKCAETSYLGYSASARLNSLIQGRQGSYFSTEEDGFLIYNLSKILEDKIKIELTGAGDHYGTLVPVLKTLLERSKDRLNLTTELPTLNKVHDDSPEFFSTFKDYVFSEEWKYFIDKKMRVLNGQYRSGFLDGLPREMDIFWAECFERNKKESLRLKELVEESQDIFQSEYVVPLQTLCKTENQRYNYGISQLKSHFAFIKKRWRISKRLFFGPRGAWYNSSIATTTNHWKLSSNENYLRMRMKLIPNPHFDPHFNASAQRDNLPTKKSKHNQDLINLGEKLKDASSEDKRDDKDDVLTEEDLKIIAKEQLETDDDDNGDRKKERFIMSEDCELVTFMSVIKGKFELTTSYIYFFDTSLSGINEEEREIQEERKDFRIDLNEIRELHLRRFNLRRSGIEFFLLDQTNHFLNFPTNRKRNKIYSRVLQLRPSNLIYGRASPIEVFRESGLTSKWVNREISNFEYLMKLNTMAGRSFNDLSQYPVFPWIIADYSSNTLDLSNPKTYRDLSKPVGIQNPKHVDEVQGRYDNFEDPSGVITKFHYGTHYSNSAMVLHYLVRVEPFTSLHIDLQSGRFDVADRQFHSIPQSWKSLYSNVNDVKELVPEFFYFPEFLINSNHFDLGVLQGTKKSPVDNVVLPPWASNPWDFINKHRRALESDFVSMNLHNWIDLIFGYKQKGEEAVRALNVFYYCTYEGAVNLDDITDPAEREALEGMINNFGQTPHQLLNEPHPQRLTFGECLLKQDFSANGISILNKIHSWKPYYIHMSTDKDPITFAQIPRSVNSAGKSIFSTAGSPSTMITVSKSGKVNYHGWSLDKSKSFNFETDSTEMSAFRKLSGPFLTKLHGNLVVATTFGGKLLLSGGHWDNSIRGFNLSKSKPLFRVIKHADVVTCLSLDGRSERFLMSGSRDTTSIIWEIRQKTLIPLQVLSGHDKTVSCVAISVEMDIAVSGSEDGTVNVYTVKEGQYIRSLTPSGIIDESFTVSLIQISYQGHVVFSGHCKQAHSLHIFTLNGHFLEAVTTDHRTTALLCIEEFLLSGDENGNLVLRDLFTLDTLKECPLLLPILGVSLSPEGTHILVPLRDGKVIVVGCN